MDQLYFFLSELGAWKKFRDNATMSIYMYIYNILLCYRLIFPHKPVSGNLEDAHRGATATRSARASLLKRKSVAGIPKFYTK